MKFVYSIKIAYLMEVTSDTVEIFAVITFVPVVKIINAVIIKMAIVFALKIFFKTIIHTFPFSKLIYLIILFIPCFNTTLKFPI